MVVDLGVRMLEWALKGRRSLVYLRKSDGELFLMALSLIFGLQVDMADCTALELHYLPQIKDAVYDGMEDDMARFNEFIWPDSISEY